MSRAVAHRMTFVAEGDERTVAPGFEPGDTRIPHVVSPFLTGERSFLSHAEARSGDAGDRFPRLKPGATVLTPATPTTYRAVRGGVSVDFTAVLLPLHVFDNRFCGTCGTSTQ